MTGVMVAPKIDSTDKDVPYITTPQHVVVRMLELADVSAGDVVYDLGSGDGRVPITAARQFGARGVGVEIDSGLVARARANAQEAGVADRATFRHADLFDVALDDATVVTLYLLPHINLRLRPKLLLELDPGDRVVSHDFDMAGWEPDRVVKMDRATLYLWTIPERILDTLKHE